MSVSLTSESSGSGTHSSKEPLRQYCLAQLDIPVWLDRQLPDFESKLQTIYRQSSYAMDSYSSTAKIKPFEVEKVEKIQISEEPVSVEPIYISTDVAVNDNKGSVKLEAQEYNDEKIKSLSSENREIEQTERTTISEKQVAEQVVEEASRQPIKKKSELKNKITEQKSNSSLNNEIDNSPEHLLELNQQIKQCQRCNHRHHSQHAILGQYLFQHKDAPTVCLLVESPSDAESKNRHYIANDYWTLFNNILIGMGLGEFNVYVTGLLKCHAPDQHQVLSEEIDACNSYILQEIEKIDADIVVSLGNFSFHDLFRSLLNTALLEEDTLSLSQIRNDQLSTRCITLSNKQVPLVSTFHLDFLSRHCAYKAQAQDDWLRVRNYLVSLQSD